MVSPPDRRDELLAALLANPAVINVVSWPGAARRPDGDLVQFDVATEAANDLIVELRTLRLEHEGTISIERIDMAFSDAAAAAEGAAPGDSSEAVVWEEVEARIRSDSTLSASFVALVAVAVLIAAVGILTDSSILIVGAMVVGPEYGPLMSMALGLHRWRRARVWRGAKAIAVSFPIAIGLTALMTWLIDLTGQTPTAYEQGSRPLTGFISRPDIYTVLVAALAAVAGVVALTQARMGSLVGVLVSVTTVPAAANVGVAVVHGRFSEAGGACVQLVVNFAVIVAVGAAMLRLQWRHNQRGQPAGAASRRAHTA